jgi:hypothetical protein
MVTTGRATGNVAVGKLRGKVLDNADAVVPAAGTESPVTRAVPVAGVFTKPLKTYKSNMHKHNKHSPSDIPPIILDQEPKLLKNPPIGFKGFNGFNMLAGLVVTQP